MNINKIVCCTDFSTNADLAVETAYGISEKYGAKLFILHVMPPPLSPIITDVGLLPEERDKSLVLKVQEQMQLRYGARVDPQIDAEVMVLDGHVSSEILKFIDENQIDLTVMGSYGLSGMGLVFFGSVAKRVAQKAACSVLIVRERTADL